MHKKNETIHLLILDPSQNEAEKLVSLLRNSGRATRAHRVTSEEDLLESLNGGTWDLFLARDTAESPTPAEALAHLNRLSKDIPLILLSEQPDREKQVAALRQGARAVIVAEHTDLLMLAITRELENLSERRRRRTLENHLRESEQRCQLLLESSRDAIAYVNDGMHIYANRSYLDFFGYDDVDDLMCIPILDTLLPEDQDDFKDFMKRFAEQPQGNATLTCTGVRSDENQLKIIMSVSSATYEGEPCVQVVVRPEHNNAELEEKLRQISSQDLITGLYNRTYLMDQLASAIGRAQNGGTMSALAYIAIDSFIQVKGQVGIAGADLVLSDITNILRTHAQDNHVLARLSDDAFCVLASPGDSATLEKLCEDIRKDIEEHLFDIGGKTVQITVSIGIAPIAESSPKAQDLLGRAHTASADVRKLPGHETGNGVLVFNPVSPDSPAEQDMMVLIQDSLDNDRFRLLFQPVINLRGEGEEHYEAFVRMVDQEGREVSPYDFLPPSGPSEMASRIDRWVVLQTVKHLAEHRSKGHNTRLFLNITAETLQDPTFTSWLSVALKAARLPGDSLIFQMGESDTTTYLKQAKEFARSLKELHCKISLNRFGCAINPFNTLKHVDVDYVKLDGSFTDEIQRNEEARENLKETVRSLQSMGKLTIVPLVENASVVSTLWQAGVNYIQGYYLQAPVPEMNYDFGEQ